MTVVTGRVDDPIRRPAVSTGTALAKVDGTLVILMGMMNRADIAAALQRAGKPASTPTAVIERGTTPDQIVVRTTLGQLAEVTLGSPSVIVVGRWPLWACRVRPRRSRTRCPAARWSSPDRARAAMAWSRRCTGPGPRRSKSR